VADAGAPRPVVTVEPLTPSLVEQRARATDRPVAIEVRDVSKTFRIRRNKTTSFKERAVHPLARQDYFELRALNRISFDIHRGEFFGIFGRPESDILRIDEVLAVSDAAFQLKCADVFHRMRNWPRTVVHVTPDMGAGPTATGGC
jgi:ABC-type polysaccharide/polyol phosphate transport system ATPase subunit